MVNSLAYTKSGDVGKSSLCGLSEKFSKSTPRFDALGDIDELNSCIGVCRIQTKDKEIDKILETMQKNLFMVGVSLATAKGPARHEIKNSDLEEMEKTIDKYHSKLPELKKFILPGGSSLASHMHLARAVCRRAERKIVSLSEKEKINPVLLSYVNRLSSLLFVLARWANKTAGVKEAEWSP